jgi:uncharacterized protein (TIGR02678 family)
MSQLLSVMERERRNERAAALRHLLAHPLTLSSQEPERFLAILRHRDWLVSWFSDHAGWKLSVEPQGGFARLYKIPATPDESRAARPHGRTDFDRRRYALLCLLLAAFEEVGGQTTLANLARRVEELSAEDDRVPTFDPTSGLERRSFVDALRLLVDLGILKPRDGDADRYAQTKEGDALFDVNERLLAHLISAPVPPAFAQTPDRLLEEVRPDTDEGERQRHRHHAVRRLLDDPVLYFEDLPEDAFAWLDHSRGFLYRVLEEEAGFTVERRAEGLSAIDPSGMTTDISFPDGGSTVKHAAILLAEQLVRLHEQGVQSIDLAEAVALVLKFHHDFGEPCNWSKQYPCDSEGCERLAMESLRLLESFTLVSRPPGCTEAEAGPWRIRAAIARFRPGTPTRRRSRTAPRNA